MTDYERVATVIDYLTQNRRAQPTLDELAAIVDLSPAHFQRLFVRWSGVSPKKFLQLLTLDAVRERLRHGQSVLDVALDEGLSGPGRLHDLTVSLAAAAPGEIKAGGEGWTITAGFADSPFGTCLIAASPRGICRLEFVENRNRDDIEQQLLTEWPNAEVRWNGSTATDIARSVFQQPNQAGQTLQCFVKGSQFQVRVWRALLSIPSGQLATYQRIAAAIGQPEASRAVGAAIGSNPVGYLIPCHRVIRKTGVVGQYRWGETRKRAVIAREFANGEVGTDASPTG